MRKSFYTLFIMFCLAVGCLAQTQQGYVKTLGRPNQKGVALSGVTVRVKGAHNAVLSKNDGTFSIMINGDSYSLQQVQKSGYELNEMGVIGRKYAYSAQVPLTVVMVSTAQLQADKQRIENKAYQVAEMNYKAKMEVLEKQKADNAITSEQYRQQIQELQDKFEKYQSLIDGLADHYAHVDYDELDEKEREINLCIENGDLERADQLLQQIGIQQRIADIESRLATGQSLMDEAYKDMAAVLKQQEKDAEYLYQLYTIALSRFDNEKAGQYIETRAALDTTNIEWQLVAADYLKTYISNYKLSMFYANRALRVAKELYNDNYSVMANCYNDLASIYEIQDSLSLSLYNFKLALDLIMKNENNYQKKAICLDNVGCVLMSQGKYEESLKYHKRALAIRKDSIDNNLQYIADSYGSIGIVYHFQGKHREAIDAFTEAYKLRQTTNDKMQQSISLNSLGVEYESISDYEKALNYYYQSLSIKRDIFGEVHPKVATTLSNIGIVFAKQKNDSLALDYFKKALDIRLRIYGDNHSSISDCYNNIGIIYYNKNMFSEALPYYLKSLDIRKRILGETHPKIAASYNNIGLLYTKLDEQTKALEYIKKGLDIRISIFGAENEQVASSYINMGIIYHKTHNFDVAIDYYKRAQIIYENCCKDNYSILETIYGNLAASFLQLKEKDKAIYYYYMAINILPPNHKKRESYKEKLSNLTNDIK